MTVEIDHDANATYWVREVRLGLGAAAASSVAVAVYALAGAGERRLEWIALPAAVGHLAAQALPWRRMVGTRHATTAFVAWVLAVVTAVAVGAGLDGGVRSPLVALLGIPILYTGLAYPARVVAQVTGWSLAALYVMAVATATADAAVVVPAVALALSGGVAATNASLARRLRRRQRELERRLAYDATHDPGTGALNRRAFDASLGAEIARARRYHRPLSVLLVDVDGLKRVNDMQGHLAGDRVLHEVCDILTAEVRSTDVVARWGGDEFGVLCTETAPGEAARLALRLVDAVALAATGVTVSVGHAALAGHVTGVDLLAEADRALYAAKHAGRNQAAVRANRVLPVT